MYFVQFSIIALVLLHGYSDAVVSTEKKLIKTLLNSYENVGLYGRPVYNQSETMRVSYGASLLDATLVEKYDHSAVFALNMWDRFLWHDDLLTWNPDDFAGVNHVRLPINQIWKPDIILYNGHPGKDSTASDVLAVASNDGTVMYILPHMVYVTCTYKGNTYSCGLKYGSWTYDGFKMDLNFFDGLAELDTSEYTSKEFTLSGNPAQHNVQYYSCCKEPYVNLVYTFNLKAK